MITSRKAQLTIGLLLIYACSPALCSESRQTETGVRFEANKKSQPWTNRHNRSGQGPVEPTHVAVFHVRSLGHYVQRDDRGVLQMLNTATGRSLSKLQQQFLGVSDSFAVWGAQNMRNHEKVMLYAVSADDARKMVRAFLEVGISEAEAKVHDVQTKLQGFENDAAKYRKEIPNKEAELATVRLECARAKIETHNPASDADAAEESKGIILEMNTVLDSLAMEIAGIEAKLAAVERVKSQNKVSSPEGLARLEDIISEQTIELAGALAKQKAAIGIREREEKFHSLYRRQSSLTKHIAGLKNALSRAESRRREMENVLAERDPYTLWTRVYQNEVTIHPVK